MSKSSLKQIIILERPATIEDCSFSPLGNYSMGTSGEKASRNLSKQESSTFGKAMVVLTVFSLPRADCFSTSYSSFCIQCFHFGSYPYIPLTFLHSFFVTLILHLKVRLLLFLPQRVLCLLPFSLFSLLICSPYHYSLACRCKSPVPSLPGIPMAFSKPFSKKY